MLQSVASIDTDATPDGIAAGDVLFDVAGTIDGTAQGVGDLNIDSTSEAGAATDGNAELPDIGTITPPKNISVTTGTGIASLNDSAGVPGVVEILTLGDVVFDGLVQSATDTVIDTDPAGDQPGEDAGSVTLTGRSSFDTLTAGEMLTIDATTDNSGTAMDGNIGLSEVGTTFTFDTVTVFGRAITDTNAANTNFVATNLILSSSAGVGTAADPFESIVEMLEGDGGTSGFFLFNDGDLIIGQVGAGFTDANAVAVVLTSNGGDVFVQAEGELTVDGAVTNPGDDDITVQAKTDIQLTPAASIKTGDGLVGNGDGVIHGFADGIVELSAGALLTTDTGQAGAESFDPINALDPNIMNFLEITPLDQGGVNVPSSGIAMVDFVLKDGASLNYEVVFDWGDGTIDRFPPQASSGETEFDGSTSYTASHFYTSNPGEPADPIPISVTAFFDYRAGTTNGIEFFTGSAGPGTGSQVFSLDTAILTVAGLGASGNIGIIPKETVEVTEREEITVFVNQQDASSSFGSDTEFVQVAASQDQSLVDQELLYFTIVDPTGEESEAEFLQIELLEKEKLLELFKTFPNNIYHIYLKQAGSVDILRLFRIEVLGNKIRSPDLDKVETVDDMSEVQDDLPLNSPAGDETSDDSASIETPTSEAIRAITLDDLELRPSSAASPRTDEASPALDSTDSQTGMLDAFRSARMAIAVAGLGSSLGLAASRSWRSRVEQAMASGDYPLSKTARLRRRLRK